MASASGASKRVLVTGGNKGIGFALCRQLAADHGFEVLLGSRDAGRGEAAVQSILKKHPELKGKVDALELDVSDDKSVTAAAKLVSERFAAEPTPLYGIINNAGVGFG